MDCAPGNGHAAAVERKQYTRPVDPFGFENIAGGANRVQLLKSEGEGAYVIRFAHNPNDDKGSNGETYSKQNQHPVLVMLKSEGFRWGFDGGDGKGGWGKRFEGDAYGADHIEARRVLQQAAEMIGAPAQARGTVGINEMTGGHVRRSIDRVMRDTSWQMRKPAR